MPSVDLTYIRIFTLRRYAGFKWIKNIINKMIKGFKPKSLEAAALPIVTFKFNTLLPREMTWIQQDKTLCRSVCL